MFLGYMAHLRVFSNCCICPKSGPIYLLENNLCITRPVKFKPVLCRGQSYFQFTVGDVCMWRVDLSYSQIFSVYEVSSPKPRVVHGQL